jgi:hypothetical protein
MSASVCVHHDQKVSVIRRRVIRLARRVRSTCSNAENLLRFRLEMGEMIDRLVDGRDLVVMIAADEMPRRR